ncbi:MAG TPA: secondary thiamine-phosphate synthase enzyme YjbQ [Syntrophorhabdaceae bacterium]
MGPMVDMLELKVRTSRDVEGKDITAEVAGLVRGRREGRIVHVYTPHTTCGLTINEHADPDVMRDLLDGLERLAPRDFHYRHREGNSHAHIRAALVGTSVTIPFSEGRLHLGTWQGIFLMEFDGPRERKVIVTVI